MTRAGVFEFIFPARLFGVWPQKTHFATGHLGPKYLIKNRCIRTYIYAENEMQFLYVNAYTKECMHIREKAHEAETRGKPNKEGNQ